MRSSSWIAQVSSKANDKCPCEIHTEKRRRQCNQGYQEQIEAATARNANNPLELEEARTGSPLEPLG